MPPHNVSFEANGRCIFAHGRVTTKPDLMTADSASCFETLARDGRWQAFTDGEHRKVDDFVRRWRIKTGDRVLEPGCGSGRLTVVLAALVGRKGRVLAFDSSRKFIRLAARRRLPAQVRLRTVRAETVRLPPASFDHVICFNVFPHLVPPAVVARRLAAALRPGGIFWIAHTYSRAFVNDVHRQGPAGIRGHLLPSRRKLTRLLREAGLTGVEIEDGADRFLARAIRPEAKPVQPPTARRHV